MDAPINNAIYSVTAFYQDDATKTRAKELVNELSSSERTLIISILNKTVDPATDCQPLTDKLIAIRTKDTTDAFLPITHEKDKDRSSCGKTLMNIWRAIKDIFGTRISNKDLINEINTFSMQAALAKLDQLEAIYEDKLDKKVPEEDMPLTFKDALLDLEFYTTDLTMTKFGSVLKDDISILKAGIANKMISALAANDRNEIKALEDEYWALLKMQDFKTAYSTIFSDFQSLTLETIVDKITEIGEQNLTENQLYTANFIFYLYLDAYKHGNSIY